jgi:hypothetical protein
MNYPHPTYLPAQATTPAREKHLQGLISAAISFKLGIPVEVNPSHRHVLSQFALGRLTIDEVVYYLEAIAATEASRG